MGGFYERLVGITKTALKKTIGKLYLTHTQLQTIITERATRVMMPNRNILQRSIIHLYPIECNDEEPNKENDDNLLNDNNVKVNHDEKNYSRTRQE